MTTPIHRILVLAPLLVGCGDEFQTAPYDQPSSQQLFGAGVTKVTVEVDYATGAEPFTAGGDVEDPWTLTHRNLDAIFDGTKTLEVPRTLDAMQDIGPQDGPFDSARLLELADAHRDSLSGDGTATFYVLFVDGYYEDDGETRKEVLGVSIGDTGVIGMFKPVVESAGGPLGLVGRYVEQATVVHELGHAVGLVDNGLATTSDHHDSPHGAHCIHEDCIMYYAVEGVGGVVEFVQSYVQSGDTVLFGSACLGDAHGALR